MPETGKAEQLTHYLEMCIKDAYTSARSACIMFGMESLESHVVSGMQSGAVRLSPADQSHVAQDLLSRLYGKTPDELIEEQRQELEEEGANLARLFNDDQA